MSSYRARRYFREVEVARPGLSEASLWEASLLGRYRGRMDKIGDTFKGIATRQVRKPLDEEGFEPLFETQTDAPGSNVTLFGRKRDSVVVSAFSSYGYLESAFIQSRRVSATAFRRPGIYLTPLGGMDGRVTGIAVDLEATYGMRHRLEYLDRLPGRPIHLWWWRQTRTPADRKHMPLVLARDETEFEINRELSMKSRALTRRRHAMLSVDWQDRLDVARQRTLADALTLEGTTR